MATNPLRSVGARAQAQRVSSASLQLLRRGLIGAVLLSLISFSLPAIPRSSRGGLLGSLLPEPAAAAGEVLASPLFVSAAVMPNGQVGLLFQNSDGIRFKRFTAELAMDPSQLLSTAGPWYPQLATFRGRLVAAYLDTRSPNIGRLTFRVSDDSGVTWGAEFYPFGTATFAGTSRTPRVVASRDGQTLYMFSMAANDTIPLYQSSTDSTLASWSAAAAAGDSSMRVAEDNFSGGQDAEANVAHDFSFMETATPGQWVYVTKSDSGFHQCGRGTQVGTLGGSWSAQVDLFGSAGVTGANCESTATTFLDGAGNVVYVRSLGKGQNVYVQRSTDGGLTWGARVSAYDSDQLFGTTGAPVGLFVTGSVSGAYVWFHGQGTVTPTPNTGEIAVRRIPLWSAPASYASSGTIRLFGSAGGDLPGSAPGSGEQGTYPGIALTPDPINIATGNFLHHATDLALPGRILALSFARSYNSADTTAGPFGPAWSHSYNWSLTDAGATVSVRRADGRVLLFTRNPDLTYAAPVGVFDTLVKNGDATYTVTLTNQIALVFSSAGVLTRIGEPAGNQINLSYTSGKLTTVTDTVGRTVTLSYDGSNRITQLQDPLGRKVTYSYDGSGRLSTVTDKIGNAAGQNPALHRWTYGYDGTSSRLATITDPDGRVGVTNTYDAQGRVYQQRDGLSALTALSYSAGQTVVTDARSNATTYTFDSRFRELAESILAGGSTRTLSYTYDSAGNRNSVTDRNGKRTDFTFDARGNVLTKTDAQVGSSPRYVTAFQYDSKNNLTQLTDARSFVTTMTYSASTNALLSLSQQIDTVPTNAVTKWEYGDAANPGLPTKIISPRGNTTGTPDYIYSQSLSYDTAGNLVQRIDSDAAKTTFGYDGVGRQTSLIDPDGYSTGGVPAEHTWIAAYDENDRVTTVTDPLAHGSTSAYDGAGNRLSATDPNSNVTSYAYDANSRLLNTKQKPDPAGQPTLIYTTAVLRDGNGNITRVTQANGAVTDYAFDALNRLTSMSTHPDGSTTLATSYVLNGNGLPTSRTTGDGVVVSYGYDEMSRLTSVSASGLSTITYSYDELSRRTQMIDGTGTTTYVYDGLSRLTQATAPNGTLTFAYDRDGNRTSLGYPGGQSVTYAYSPGGRLTTTTDWASRASSYAYKASGLVSSLSYPNTMQATYTFDRAQRLTELTNKVGVTTITDHSYGLDAAGNRTTMDEFVQGITQAGNDHFTYGYDGLNRLLSVAGPVAETFVLDAASNLASRTGPTATYSYDTSNRLTSDGSRSFSWNGADREVQRGRDTFAFDALGRLTSSQIVDDATLISGPTWSTTDVPNASAASLSFNGTTAYAEAPHTPAQNINGDWTVEAWFKDATAGGYNHNDTFILMKGDSNVDGEAPYFLKLGYKVLSAGSRTAWTSYQVGFDLVAGGVSANAWHHAAATFAASTRQLTLYVDGVQKAQGTLTASTAIGSAKPLSIGRNGTTGANWNGKLDDIRIWNVVRTASQISTSYQTELSSSPAGLVANYKLNDASGSTATDVGVARAYTYNGDGLLKSRTEAGASTQLLWDAASVPAQLLVSSADRIVHGLGPLYIVRGDNTTKTLATDGLGSVRAEVNDAGAVSASFRYAVYGRPVTKPVTPTLLGYAGELGDSSGLLYLRARWYDPSTARFVVRDPLGADAATPQSLNGFGYAATNPSRYIDPTGLDTESPENGAASGAIISNLIATAAAVIGEQIPTWTTATDVILTPGVVVATSARGAAAVPVVIAESVQTVERVSPLLQFAKRLFSNPLTGGLVSGAAQAWEDSGRAFSVAQRFDRIAIAVGIGIAIAAVGVGAIVIGAPVAVVAGGVLLIGLGADLFLKPWLFERRGYAH